MAFEGSVFDKATAQGKRFDFFGFEVSEVLIDQKVVCSSDTSGLVREERGYDDFAQQVIEDQLLPKTANEIRDFQFKLSCHLVTPILMPQGSHPKSLGFLSLGRLSLLFQQPTRPKETCRALVPSVLKQSGRSSFQCDTPWSVSSNLRPPLAERSLSLAAILPAPERWGNQICIIVYSCPPYKRPICALFGNS